MAQITVLLKGSPAELWKRKTVYQNRTAANPVDQAVATHSWKSIYYQVKLFQTFICGDIATFLFYVRSVMVHEIWVCMDGSDVSGSGYGTDLLSSTLHHFRQVKYRGPALRPAP